MVPLSRAAAARRSLSAPEGLPLRGSLVAATWDQQLSGEMAARGCAIHEESVLPDLLARLRSDAL